uniref:RRM domain-containing protein n=1 Tax=Globisporangium ultimum (strain ATCC 200006 / CBS 805.95 / DAOM BR144) TaxID=431595 RepID=K3WF34_GLOUD
MAPTSPPLSMRVYVGGLPADTNEKELQERFARFVSADHCQLRGVELLAPKGLFTLNADATHRGFAYLTLEGDATPAVVEKLVKTYNKTKWRGSVLRVEPANPDYMVRLQQEWQEQREFEEMQKVIRAEARGLAVSSSEKSNEELIMNMGVEFQGTKRTTFDYDDLDLDAAFAPKKKAVVTPAVVGSNGYQDSDDDEPMDHTETESSDANGGQSGESEEDEDDEGDADYWGSSGDEQDETAAPAEEVNDEDGSDYWGSSEDEQDESAAAPATSASVVNAPVSPESSVESDAVAMDDVEAFVQQIEQEEAEAKRAVATAATADLKKETPMKEKALEQQVEREEANARRIAALEAKMKQKQQQQQQQARIDLTATSNKKITFDDSGNEEEEGAHDDEDEAGHSGAITNWLDSSDDEEDEKRDDYGELRDGSDTEQDDKKKTKRLGLAFDDDNDEDEDAKAFAVRPEFLGERGKKLFELQKRFGGDQRFRMDARFIEDEENEYGGNDNLLLDNDELASIADGPAGKVQQFQAEDGEDEAAKHEREFLAEQDLSLSVIAELFPDIDVENIKYKLRVKVKKDPIKEASWMGQMKRYDPRDVHSRNEFEIPIEDPKKQQQQKADADDANDALAKEKKKREEKEVLIGGERFFSTSNNLGSMFTRVRKNSEDGIEGEAALDGVFGFSRGLDASGAAASSGSAGGNSGASTFRLSSLFDFPVEEDKEKNARLTAMGETLFEDGDDHGDNEDKPWHFTQSFFSEEKDDEDDAHMDTDNEEDDGNDVEEDNAADGNAKTKKKVIKRSLTEFLAFGNTFCVNAEGNSGLLNAKDWTEKRKKLTLDFKRKRKDALRNKKKLQQRVQKQQYKKQKLAR